MEGDRDGTRVGESILQVKAVAEVQGRIHKGQNLTPISTICSRMLIISLTTSRTATIFYCSNFIYYDGMCIKAVQGVHIAP